MAEGFATLGGLSFRVDPEAVSWDFTVKTKVTSTVGGRVIQIFGTKVGDMKVSGSVGVGGYADHKRLVDNIKYLAEAQLAEDARPYRFTLPQENLSVDVWIKDIADDQGATITREPGLFNQRFTLTFQLADDNAELSTIATDAYIARLTQGIGWVPNEYNGPVDVVAGMPADTEWEDTATTTSMTADELTQVTLETALGLLEGTLGDGEYESGYRVRAQGDDITGWYAPDGTMATSTRWNGRGEWEGTWLLSAGYWTKV